MIFFWIVQMLLTGGVAIYCGTTGHMFLGLVNAALFGFGLAAVLTILLRAQTS